MYSAENLKHEEIVFLKKTFNMNRLQQAHTEKIKSKNTHIIISKIKRD